jgi:hypothetical protein
MPLYKYGAVEALEDKLTEIFGKPTDEQFTKRRVLLSEYIFPLYDELQKRIDEEIK